MYTFLWPTLSFTKAHISLLNAELAWRFVGVDRTSTGTWFGVILCSLSHSTILSSWPGWSRLWPRHSCILPLPFWPLSAPCLLCQRDTAGPLLPSALCWSPLLTSPHLSVCLAWSGFFAVQEPCGPACFYCFVPLQPLILWAAAACCLCCTGRWSSSFLGHTPAS